MSDFWVKYALQSSGSKIATKCWGVLRYFYQLLTLHKTLKLFLVKALILSRIDHANTVLIGCNKSDLKPLNAVSRGALRYVFSKNKFYSISKHFISAHVLPVKYRIIFCALTLIHRILREENVSPYLYETIWKWDEIFELPDGIKPEDLPSKYIAFFNEKIMSTTERFNINVGGDYLEEASQIEFLWVIFESNMRFKAQVQK